MSLTDVMRVCVKLEFFFVLAFFYWHTKKQGSSGTGNGEFEYMYTYYTVGFNAIHTFLV